MREEINIDVAINNPGNSIEELPPSPIIELPRILEPLYMIIFDKIYGISWGFDNFNNL